MTITNETTIETLITLGLISSDQIESWNKRATKLEARQASRQLVQGTSEIIMQLLESDLQTDTRFFSSNLPEISLTVCQFRDISDDASVASMPGRTTRFRQGKIYLSSSSFPSDSLFLSLLSAFSRRKHLNLKTHLSSLFCTLRNAGYF